MYWSHIDIEWRFRLEYNIKKYKEVFWEPLKARKKVLKVLTVQVFLTLSMILHQKRWFISGELRLDVEIF